MKVEDAEPDSYVDEHGRFFKPAAVRPLPSEAKKPCLSHSAVEPCRRNFAQQYTFQAQPSNHELLVHRCTHMLTCTCMQDGARAVRELVFYDALFSPQQPGQPRLHAPYPSPDNLAPAGTQPEPREEDVEGLKCFVARYCEPAIRNGKGIVHVSNACHGAKILLCHAQAWG